MNRILFVSEIISIALVVIFYTKHIVAKKAATMAKAPIDAHGIGVTLPEKINTMSWSKSQRIIKSAGDEGRWGKYAAFFSGTGLAAGLLILVT